jgi:hypothetical protein
MCVVEELIEHADGGSEWVRAPFPVPLDRSVA